MAKRYGGPCRTQLENVQIKDGIPWTLAIHNTKSEFLDLKNNSTDVEMKQNYYEKEKINYENLDIQTKIELDMTSDVTKNHESLMDSFESFAEKFKRYKENQSKLGIERLNSANTKEKEALKEVKDSKKSNDIKKGQETQMNSFETFAEKFKRFKDNQRKLELGKNYSTTR